MAKKGYRLMYGVDYDRGDGESTFEIFPKIRDALKFDKKMNNGTKKNIFQAYFNKKRIFKEEGKWNYDDRADLWNWKRIRVFNQNGKKNKI